LVQTTGLLSMHSFGMKTSPRPSWLAFAALLTLASLARATTILVPDFDGMVGKSDCIVRAVVKTITAEWRVNPANPGQRYISTLVELDVKEVIKGTPPSPLVLDFVGGRIGDLAFTIEGAPTFTVGQEGVFFVKGNGRRIVPLVGLSHGHYPVHRDKRTGRDEVRRNSGKPLYDEHEVSLPESAASAAPAANLQARPLTAAEFADRIRKSRNFSQHDPLE